MVRSRLLRLALAAGLGLTASCATTPDPCAPPRESFLSRLNPFRACRNNTETVVVPYDGPILTEPPCDSTLIPVVPQSAGAPLPAPRPVPQGHHSQPMPYQP